MDFDIRVFFDKRLVVCLHPVSEQSDRMLKERRGHIGPRNEARAIAFLLRELEFRLKLYPCIWYTSYRLDDVSHRSRIQGSTYGIGASSFICAQLTPSEQIGSHRP